MLQQRSKSVGPWERFSGYFKITKEKRSTAKLTTLACLKLAQQEVTRYKHFGLLCYDICDKENKFQNIDTRKRGILNSIQIAIIQTFSLRASFGHGKIPNYSKKFGLVRSSLELQILVLPEKTC